MALLPYLLLLNSLIALAAAATTEQWKSRSIYFALTDRIARSSSDTGGAGCGNLKNYCGGTFKGLESKLDYIRGMGFDAIWITPVVASEFPCSMLVVVTDIWHWQTKLEDTMGTGHRICTALTRTTEVRLI